MYLTVSCCTIQFINVNVTSLTLKGLNPTKHITVIYNSTSVEKCLYAIVYILVTEFCSLSLYIIVFQLAEVLPGDVHVPRMG